MKLTIGANINLEFLSPFQFDPIRFTVQDFYDERTDSLIDTMSSGHLGQSILIPVSGKYRRLLPPLTVARIQIKKT